MESTGKVDLAEQNEFLGVEKRAKRFGLAEGKPQLSLILDFGKALKGACLGLQEGADKYGRGNWKKGMPENEIIDSLMRHLEAHVSGEVVDPGSKTGATHLDKILCNAMLLRQLADF